MHGGHLREEAALAAVGTLVEDEPSAARHERAVAARSGLELDDHSFAPMTDGDELLATGEDELDRAARRPGERGHVSLEVEVAFRAEAAAEEWHHDPDVRLGNLQRVSDSRTGRVRHLRRRPHRHLAALPLRDHGARLDRHSLGAISDEPVLHDDLGRRPCPHLHRP